MKKNHDSTWSTPQRQVHRADLKPSEGLALKHELHVETEELRIIESQQNKEEAQEAQLRSDLKQLQVAKSDQRGQRQELLATVALGVSELSEELMAQHLQSKTELDFAQTKFLNVKNNSEAKAAELRAIKERMHEVRLLTESESKEISQRSRELCRKTLADGRKRDEEIQEELLQLEQREADSVRVGSHGAERSARNQETKSSRSSNQTHEADMLRETLLDLKEQKTCENFARELRAELHAAKERANELALKCEQTWNRLTCEKRRAAAFAAESFEAEPLHNVHGR